MLTELAIMLDEHIPPLEDIARHWEDGVTAKFYNISVDREVWRNYLSSRKRFTGWRGPAGCTHRGRGASR